MPKTKGVLYQNKLRVIDDRVAETESASMRTFLEYFLDSSAGIAFYRKLCKLKRADFELLLDCLEYEYIKNRDEEDKNNTEVNMVFNQGTPDERRPLPEPMFRDLKIDHPESTLGWWLYFDMRIWHPRANDGFIPTIQAILRYAKNI